MNEKIRVDLKQYYVQGNARTSIFQSVLPFEPSGSPGYDSKAISSLNDHDGVPL